ncbi:MAG TPA: GMC family oxidoreductase [Solirubrobacteraceae bacterium]|jgi:choline dehydrogenase-like flavoprotein|nr:GMC family oxidoreductase [Solirubrobacteraceae bacterium]
MSADLSADIVIVGTGAGGGTLAYALKDSGADVLLLERGDFLPQEDENWSPKASVTEGRYKANDPWEHGNGTFIGSNHYCVGGMTKAFGGTMARFRPQDLDAYELDEGLSPAWPISYADLEPYYVRAEQIWGIRGDGTEDPMEPWRSAPYFHPAVPNEPRIDELAARLRAQGLHPYKLPMGVAAGDGGPCLLGKYCDGFICKVLAKCDADVRCVRPALESPTVRLQTNAYAERLLTDRDGRRVTAVEVRINGELQRVTAGKVVVCAGGVNSAALLLRSASTAHPKGLANSSDQVGRNYMQHINTALMAVDPRRANPTVFQKTLGINDFYLSENGNHPRLGSAQLTGRLLVEHVRGVYPWMPRSFVSWLTDRSVDWWLMTEDCPLPQNRVVLGKSGRNRIEWAPSSLPRHKQLVRNAAKMMRRAGYPFVFTRRFGVDTNAEQAGTLRFGVDPSKSVLDPLGKAHDLENLWSVDASFLPSSGAGPGGPTLTIAAQALRIAEQSDLLR